MDLEQIGQIKESQKMAHTVEHKNPKSGPPADAMA